MRTPRPLILALDKIVTKLGPRVQLIAAASTARVWRARG
jgi:hypothetical protein